MFLILLYRLLNRSAEVVYVHGGWYRRALIVYYGAKAAKIKVVPYGVDADDKVDNATQEHYSKLLGHRKSVLCFGSVSPRKDIEGLIRAFGIFSQSHPDYVLVIAGNETLDFRWYGEHLKKVVNKLGLADDVLFLGFVSDSAVHALYRLSHFLVLPYVYAFEGPSGPLAFAVQHGLPVIGTDVGHLREEVHNLADGLLVPLDNPVALSQAMTTLADNLQLRERLAKNIIKKRIGASWRDVAAETYLGYKRMLELDCRT
jgi:glycosyltransferase involved in cell wall biosynthesis